MVDNPCKPDCPERTVGCHGKCPRYAAFWAESEKRRKQRELNRQSRDMREGLRKSFVKKAARQRQWREK